MARARNIKPGFFKNENLVELPFETRLLFIGLWTVADREGRLEDRPKRIKMELFPADNVDIDDCLGQLHRAGFINRYVVGQGKYIQVLAFTKHQNPHQKEAASTIPAPDSVPVDDTEVLEEHDASPVQAPDEHHASPAESLNPITDSPLSESPSPQPRASRDETETHERRFDVFWSVYPKKIGKGAARAWWLKRKPSQEFTEQIVAAVQEQVQSAQWVREGGQYIPNPTTWLNQERWQDELPRASPANISRFQNRPTNGAGPRGYSADELVRDGLEGLRKGAGQ